MRDWAGFDLQQVKSTGIMASRIGQREINEDTIMAIPIRIGYINGSLRDTPGELLDSVIGLFE